MVEVLLRGLATRLLQHGPIVEAFVATTLTFGRIKHCEERSRNLTISKISKEASVSVTFYGWDFRSKSVNGAVRSLK
jgi:hypothetical protein